MSIKYLNYEDFLFLIFSQLSSATHTPSESATESLRRASESLNLINLISASYNAKLHLVWKSAFRVERKIGGIIMGHSEAITE